MLVTQIVEGVAVDFGSRIAAGGDLDGDGYGDLLVAGTYGSLWVLRGGPGGLSPEPWSTLSLPPGEAFTAGDVDGDGLADLIVGSSVYLGRDLADGRTVPSIALEGDGALAVASGDIDGDGVEDAVVAEYWTPCATDPSWPCGEARFYRGPLDTASVAPDWTIAGDAERTNIGYSLVAAGDVNGDGRADIAIGQYRAYDPQPNTALLFLGSAAGPVEADDVPGGGLWQLHRAGDIDGDGYADLVVLESGEDGVLVHLYRGGEDGLSHAPGVTLTGDGHAEGFANAGPNSVIGGGDTNGDGFDDLLVAAPLAPVLAGESPTGLVGVVHRFLGSEEGPVGDEEIANASASHTFASVALADINGDGLSDSLIGAPSTVDGGVGRIVVVLGEKSPNRCGCASSPNLGTGAGAVLALALRRRARGSRRRTA